MDKFQNDLFFLRSKSKCLSASGHAASQDALFKFTYLVVLSI